MKIREIVRVWSVLGVQIVKDSSTLFYLVFFLPLHVMIQRKCKIQKTFFFKQKKGKNYKKKKGSLKYEKISRIVADSLANFNDKESVWSKLMPPIFTFFFSICGCGLWISALSVSSL